MKTLILTCNTGGGHNSSAKAIKEYFEAHGTECDVTNYLSFTNKAKSSIITKGHVFCYRYIPKIFGMGYKFEEEHAPKFIYKQCAETADRLYEYVVGGGYETVICVHVFAALAMTEIRKKYNPPLKQYFVATDYTCSPGVSDEMMDGYFVPFGCKDEFVRCGVPEDKIFETGIPIAPRFYITGDKALARKQLGLCEGGKLAVLMCGSMGAGPMLKLSVKMAQNLPEDAQLVVICGSNKMLFNQLSAKNLCGVKVVGFTDKMNDFMDAADLLISKPGGLSSTESFFKHLPLICMDTVPGCETRNIEFFKKHGYAFCAKTIDELVECSAKLLDCPEKLDGMRKRLEETFNYSAVANIYNCVF